MTAITKTAGYIESGKVFYLDPRHIKVVEGFNPRGTTWGDDEDKALERYIKENGTLKLPPLFVRHINDSFALSDGWRRLTATMTLIEGGMEIVSIPCLIDEGDDLDAIARSVTSNAGKPLTKLEEAEAYLRMVNMGTKIKDIAKRTGRSTPYVSQRLTLAKGDPEVLELVAKKELTINAALAAIRQSNGNNLEQKILAEKAIKKKLVTKQKAEEQEQAISQVEKEEKIESTAAEKKMFTLLDTHGVDGCLAMMSKIAQAKIKTASDERDLHKWKMAYKALETAMA